MTDNTVELKGINKQYPGSLKIANNNIDLALKQGEILCIAGENGAGKTTLMKILCGLEAPDAGAIYIDGKKETIESPLKANKLGIGMVHQHFALFPEYTVAENIVMGEEPKKFGILFDTQKAINSANKIIEDNDFAIHSTQKVKDLSVGQMQQVEICRILHRNARIIILDEPTSVLTERETESLFNTLKRLKNNGKSIILITHKLNEIKKVCDRVVVLRRGEVAGNRSIDDVDEYEIARLMMGDFIGKDIHTKAQRREGTKEGEAIIKFENVTVKKKGQQRLLLDNVSFSVRAAEILGITGVGGNGLGVIEAVLGGFLHPAKGKVFHNGKDITMLNTQALREQGLSYVPSDRIRLGSARDAAIEENMIINRRHELNKKMAEEFSNRLYEEYNIEGAAGNKKCAVLSGGNLQKLILAREIDFLKDYIVFSEPTWGLDIASSNFIMNKIDEIGKKGAAVILISSNLNEITALSEDRKSVV
jgi:simple sugar transport system ATP-binding protein